MTKEELNQLGDLLGKLRRERIEEINAEDPDFDCSDTDDLYEYDDGDRLCEGIDIVLTVIDNMRGE